MQFDDLDKDEEDDEEDHPQIIVPNAKSTVIPYTIPRPPNHRDFGYFRAVNVLQ